MNIELNEQQQIVVKRALESYLSNLREEIVKTEKHEWKVTLHKEEDILKEVIGKLV